MIRRPRVRRPILWRGRPVGIGCWLVPLIVLACLFGIYLLRIIR